MATKTMTMQRTEELVRMHLDFFNNRKLEEGARHATEDCEWTVVPFDEKYHGPKGYVECNQMWTTAFPDGKVEIVRLVAQGNLAAVELRGRGTHKGPLPAPDGDIRATNRKVDLPFVEIYEFKNEKLHRARTYFDGGTLFRQLGIEQ